MKDRIYVNKKSRIDDFKFDAEVARVFPDMIARSVPAYKEIINLSGSLASMHIKTNSNVYDLGCSLGASSMAIRAHAPDKKHLKLIAVDSSSDMVKVCKKNLHRQKAKMPFEVVRADIADIKIQKASVVVMNFTLQFIPQRQRLNILRKIYSGLKPDGILIMAEKTFDKSKQTQTLLEKWHKEFKKAHGYSELEIVQKRNALENVLVSESEQTHIRRLKTAGFKSVQKWFQAYSFKAFIAFKN